MLGKHPLARQLQCVLIILQAIREILSVHPPLLDHFLPRRQLREP
jgi:hypothetical protein